MQNAPVYKAHRIHTKSTMSGLWVSIIVSIGTRNPLTKDSLTDSVTRVPGEHHTEGEAIQAAKRYIDAEDSHRQD